MWIVSCELLGQFAAVDGDGSAREVRRLVRCNKHDGLGDLFGSPYAFERHSRDQPGLPFVRTGEPVQHPSLDRTGTITFTRTLDPAGASRRPQSAIIPPSTASDAPMM